MSNQFLYRNDDNQRPVAWQRASGETAVGKTVATCSVRFCLFPPFDWGKVCTLPSLPTHTSFSRFPARCVLTFKQFSGSQRSDNDDAGQTSSGRSKECRGAEEVGGAGGAEGAGRAGGSAERDHGALCASVSDFVSFLTLRGGQRSCFCRHCQYFTLASFL